MRRPASLIRRLVGGVAVSAAVLSTVFATPANGSTMGGNPFLGRSWGVYQGPAEQSWTPYVNATGATKQALGYIALTPKMKWFGAWIPVGGIARAVTDYITASQAADPNALVQFAVFRMDPWEGAACTRLPTPVQQASYKAWIGQLAGAVGSTPTAIVLQPDGPFALCAPGHSPIPSQLIAYSARVLSALPHTSVYIDAGAADWPAAGRPGGAATAVRLLVADGVRYARGFALNSTHYSAVSAEVLRAAEISRGLAALGIRGKKAVVDTATNGHPFVFGRYTGTDPDNATVCPSRATPATVTCVTLGIPPTADVANPRWGLSATIRSLALAYVDAYVWSGRPWLYRQADPFVQQRALALVNSTPWRLTPR